MEDLGWILEDNLEPFVETLSILVGYRFDDWDWDAIRFGAKDTDYHLDRWYEYELIGDRGIKLRLAQDPYSIVVLVQVETETDLRERAATAVDIMSEYRLSRE